MQTEMPRYRSHKTVWALKVREIKADEDGALITPEEKGYAPFKVDPDYVRKHDPKIGGYFVVYEDGYQSWSPAEAFDSGYTRI